MQSLCVYCHEVVSSEEQAPVQNFGGPEANPVHQDCVIHAIAGSVGHQLRWCPHYGGTRRDPPGFSRRGAAWLAARLFYAFAHREFDPGALAHYQHVFEPLFNREPRTGTLLASMAVATSRVQ